MPPTTVSVAMCGTPRATNPSASTHPSAAVRNERTTRTGCARRPVPPSMNQARTGRHHRGCRARRRPELHLRRVAGAQLPAVLRRTDGLQHRHLDAADRAGLAGPVHHQFAAGRRHHHRAAVPADAAVRPVGRTRSPTGSPSACCCCHPGRDGPAGRRRSPCSPSTGSVEVWQVYLIALGLGFATVFDNPARQTFVNELVPTALVRNAVALNSGNFQLARMVGPAVAGVLDHRSSASAGRSH